MADVPVERSSYELARKLQLIKIKELRETLVTAGYRHLTAQARAPGLARSTTWSILQANDKGEKHFRSSHQTDAGPTPIAFVGLSQNLGIRR